MQFVIDTYQQQALVEAFIAGREFAIGMLGNGAELEVLPIVEIDLQGDPNMIQTQDDKLQKPLDKICPAPLSEELAERMRQLAKDCFNALGISDFARIDIRMDADGTPYVLELNSMASLGRTGSYLYAAQTAGYTYDSLVNRMLDVAAVRYLGSSPPPELETLPAEKEKEEAKPLRVRVRSHIRSNLTTMQDNLRHVVEMDTYVYNSEGVNEFGNWLSGRLNQLGFKRQVHPQTEVGNALYFSNHDGEQNSILLLSHLDTSYTYRDYVPFREERGRFYGSGIAECKGGLTVMLAALQALRFTRRLRSARCGILLTTDDVLGGRFGRKLVTDHSVNSKYVVGLKHGEADGSVVTSCSGRADFSVELTNAKSENGAVAPDVITLLCQKLIAWEKLSSDEQGIRLKPTQLEARTLYGLAPDYATSSLFMQFRERHQGDSLEKQIRELGRKNLPAKCQLRIQKSVARPPFIETPQTQAFYAQVQSIAKRLEVKTAAAHRATSSDICYVPDSVPALEGFGPVGGGTRTPHEHILRDSLIDRAAVLAMVIRLAAEEK